MNYEIQKGVPHTKHWLQEPKYPFAKLEVGDSFLVPISEGTPTNIRVCAQNARLKNPGHSYSIYFMKEEGGTRVWRVK